MNPAATCLPSSVRSFPEPGRDPVEQVVPIVRHLICVRAAGTVVAGRNAVLEAGKCDKLLIFAQRVVFIKLFRVHMKVMCAHGGDENWHRDILQRAGCRIVAGTPVNLLVVQRVSCPNRIGT